MVDIGEITSEELDKKDCKVIKKDSPSNPENLIAICKSKIQSGDLGVLAPLYLKKSQAERELEAKNMDKMGIK